MQKMKLTTEKQKYIKIFIRRKKENMRKMSADIPTFLLTETVIFELIYQIKKSFS